MTTLSHDNRLLASTLTSAIEVELLRTRLSRQAGSLSARWAAFVGADALTRHSARNRRDVLGADAELPIQNHVRDEFGRPIL